MTEINSFIETLKEIANNTEPLDLFKHNLAWWSFGIASIGVIISMIAASYSYLGYKYQKKSAESLAKMLPGHISLFSISKYLVNSIFIFQSLLYDKKQYSSFAIKLIVESNKLPEDLIDLKRYEKNRSCYDAAFKLILSWRKYNSYLDSIYELYLTPDNKIDEDYVRHAINSCDLRIYDIMSFENLLLKHGYVNEIHTSPISLSWYILDEFFMRIPKNQNNFNNIIPFFKYSTSKIHGFPHYLIPRKINFDEYIKDDQSTDRRKYYNRLISGEYDFIRELLPNKTLPPLSKVIFDDFSYAFEIYVEPIIVGVYRLDFSEDLYDALIDN